MTLQKRMYAFFLAVFFSIWTLIPTALPVLAAEVSSDNVIIPVSVQFEQGCEGKCTVSIQPLDQAPQPDEASTLVQKEDQKHCASSCFTIPDASFSSPGDYRYEITMTDAGKDSKDSSRYLITVRFLRDEDGAMRHAVIAGKEESDGQGKEDIVFTVRAKSTGSTDTTDHTNPDKPEGGKNMHTDDIKTGDNFGHVKPYLIIGMVAAVVAAAGIALAKSINNMYYYDDDDDWYLDD